MSLKAFCIVIGFIAGLSIELCYVLFGSKDEPYPIYDDDFNETR